MHVWLLLLWEDFGRVVDVELRQILGVEEWSSVLARGCEHRRQETAGARAGNNVEVVSNPSIWSIQFLHRQIPRTQRHQLPICMKKEQYTMAVFHMMEYKCTLYA